MTSFTVLAVLGLLLSETLATPGKPISDKLMSTIEAWAPLVWLHPQEVFFPSSVDYHFQHVEVRASNESVVQTSPDRSTVVTGPETRGMHLNSVPDLECADCLLDWFAGQNISQTSVPTYVFVRDYQDACGTVDVVYRAFYPYNYGKDVCIGLPVGDLCDGLLQSFGNHVGDWEHFSIRIRNERVTECYVAVHSFGAWYTWNDTFHNFQFMEGEQSRLDLIDVTYPATVEVVEGLHPELFTANGSHGLWSQEGTHEYVHFPVYLQDQAERGYPWRTWNFLEVVNYDPDTVYEGELHYLDYRGSWGNQKRGCEVQPVSGECVLDGGPSLWRPGPSDYPDDCAAH